MLAVIKIGGRQYIVEEGKKIFVELPRGSAGNLDIKNVLLVADGLTDNKADKIFQLGKPLVENAKVNAVILGQKKGKKIEVLKYRSKTRYRKKIGFRPILTEIAIEKIIV